MTRSLLLAAVATLSLATTGDAAPQKATRAASLCIDSSRIVSRRAVTPETLEFTLPRGRVYRSTVPQSCPHLMELDRTYVIVFDDRNGQRICAGDRFRIVDPIVARAGGIASFPGCRFGPFRLANR